MTPCAKKLVYIFCIAIGVCQMNMAHAAKCASGQYLGDSGTCVSCGTGYYCPAGEERIACPEISGRLRTTFPSDYYDAKIYSSQFATYTTNEVIEDCRLLTWLSNSRGKLYEYVRYNPSTDKYDKTYFYDWADVNAGYYLNGRSRCGSYAYYSENAVCLAGGYCPGKSRVSCNSSNQATVHTETFGLEVCGDNSYSDAGASSCTPCPAGTGNSGSSFSDHAGVSSCKAISCPAGQEAVNYTCTACKAGYYKASAGTGSCTQCTDYKYASGTGNTTCIYPPAGYNSNGCSSGKGCTGQEACGSSWYCPGDGQYYSCPSNSRGSSNTPKSISECLCDAGYGRSGNVCNECSKGYYKSGSNNNSCTSCGANMTTPSTGSTSASACTCIANYADYNGECQQLCTAGFTTLNSNGVSVNAYADKLTTPSINISANGKTCYVPLASGSAYGAINVSYDSKTYHTTN